MYTPIFYLIVFFIVIEFVWDRFLLYLNTTQWSDKVPAELEGIYDASKYAKQQQYSRVNYRYGWFTSVYGIVLVLAMLFFQGFSMLDRWVLNFTDHEILRAILFLGALGLGSALLNLPFSLYSTFVIEERFGFNKTTPKIFVLDLFKSMLIGAILGGGILALIMWFVQLAGDLFWLYAWGLMTCFMLLMTMFYTSVLLPLFNKQTPLEDGELKTAIQAFCEKVGFKLDNIYMMDGSKRSTKANAFFSGLGAKKRIVLYDTLVKDLEVDEIVGVLAHEIGHYKKKHTLWGMISGIMQTGIMLYVFALFVYSPELSQALGVQEPAFHIGLIAFGILYSPISGIAGLFSTLISRKNEYEADAFAAKYHNAESLIKALKTISVNALSNLTPHPWFVFFHYSHPPLLSRIKALNKYS
ncbi:M48 family metallopeptidase [Saccharicrinis fermentans]|uniref:Heat shock protein HtpX n=1 Tax=Saccharicrinis fermentans DSM 9555 = JCM 21142 TaxID=869213 RepID=W7XWH6_9BACT|nr:M48 family metallopeptidase [Saccharicrinis fermentans]GAF02670.1 heat shock protein HtpX [Saccharicrinis fermentans DSM 9555 = JCM 21142]